MDSHITIYNNKTGQTHSMNLSTNSAQLLTSLAIRLSLADELLRTENAK
jgi:hypothetical protein